MPSSANLYEEYHVTRQDERLQLFQEVCKWYSPRSALYPGCFVHVTPSLVIPRVVYVDSDRRAARFFASTRMLEIVTQRKQYPEPPIIHFHAQSYENPLDEPESSFDLLVSQYAGFVSRACKQYLRVGGHLVANNSHGDASMASLDPDYRLVAVYKRRGERFTLIDDDLQSYMVVKKPPAPSREDLERTQRGPGFVRPASGYIFERLG